MSPRATSLILTFIELCICHTGSSYKKFENHRLWLPETDDNAEYVIPGPLDVPEGGVRKCQEHCDNDASCKLFNYSKTKKRCWFKTVTRDQGFGEWQYKDDFDAYEKGELR